MAKRKSVKPPSRTATDWQYLIFYTFFYICLVFIALFGVMAET